VAGSHSNGPEVLEQICRHNGVVVKNKQAVLTGTR